MVIFQKMVKQKKITEVSDDIYSDPSVEYDNIKKFNFKYCSVEDLFSEVIEQVNSKEANGIIILEIKGISRTGADGKINSNRDRSQRFSCKY